MKKKLAPMAAALLLSLGVGSVVAATGTISFAGTLTTPTCTVSGLTDSITFRTASLGEVEPLLHGAAIDRKPINIKVTACPAGVNTAKLKVNFNADSSGVRIEPDSGSTMDGATMVVRRGVAYISNDGVIDAPIISGEAEIDDLALQFIRVRSGDHGSATFTPGVRTASVNLSMSYE